MVHFDASSQTRVDMANARSQATIDIPVIRDLLYDGRENWDAHCRVQRIVSEDPVFDKSQRDFLGRGDLYRRGLAMTNRILELEDIHKWSSQETSEAMNMLDETLPIRLHLIAFEPVLLSQGSASMLQRYRHLAANKAIHGCYLQTELGHGTNVSRLETTATYIPETDEFDIHSPTLTSRKWWIGALGKTATHGVVQAKLILPGGKDVGPHLFLVQLRSLEDHRVLPGLTIGDIGPKALGGNASNDNGFASFNHVKIPRDNMLSRFAQVTRDGQYVKPPHAKLSYGGMLYIRSSMVISGGWTMAKAATISIRYTTVRRQGGGDVDGLERQVISYPSTFYRLLPILSRAYVFILLGQRITTAFNEMSSRLASGDASLLPEIHATTAGLKILVSTTGTEDLETARRSMGGHGYSAFSGLGRIYADYVPSATYEGDNFVLDGQVIRTALKSYSNIYSTKTSSMSSLSPFSSYLRLCHSTKPPQITNSSTWDDLASVILLLELRAAFVVRDFARNQGDDDASASQRVSRAVVDAFVATQIGHIVKDLHILNLEKRVISDLLRLYLLTTIESNLVDFLSFNILPRGESGDPARSLRLSIRDLCLELLPNAIGLTDAFGFSDWELNSALGVYDGNVYEALWKRAQEEPLNKDEVTLAYEESIKPMLQRGHKLALRGRSKLCRLLCIATSTINLII